MAYLDHASATPWHPAALATYQQVAGSLIADPTRRHAAGRRARDLLESARGAIAGMFGAPPDRIVMTSGGTEAIHLAVLGGVAANRTRPRRIVSSAVEHSAVLAAADASGYACAQVAVDRLGRVDLDGLRSELGKGAALVNLMHANHEVGTLQPVAEVAALCREHDALLHVDACQTAGRLPVDLGGLGAGGPGWSICPASPRWPRRCCSWRPTTPTVPRRGPRPTPTRCAGSCASGCQQRSTTWPSTAPTTVPRHTSSRSRRCTATAKRW